MEGGGGGGGKDGVNHFDRLPEGAWDEIFLRVPHLSRQHSRCVCSKWNRFLKSLQQHRRSLILPRPGCCLAMLMSDDRERVEGWMFAPEETDSGTRLEVEFPPGWTPEANAGGFRASGDLAAFFLEGHYWVGNPVHDKWEKVPEPVQSSTLQFDKRRFELVVDEDGRRYQIVQFRLNENGHHRARVLILRGNDWVREDPSPTRNVRQVENWVIEVYCSRTRMWRAGATVDIPVFRRLCDFCVLDKTVYFLGWNYWDSLRIPPVGLHRQLELYNSVVVWGYDLDRDTLAEVLPAAHYLGDEVANRPPGYLQMGYPCMRLHVSKQPGQAEQRLAFSITQVTFVRRSYGHGTTEKLKRFLLDQHQPERWFWYVESTVDFEELTEGGPQAALVADTWGLSLVFAYSAEDIDPSGNTMRFMLYQRDDKKWVEWEVPGTGTTSRHLQEGPAVAAFLPCECLQF